MNTDWRWNLIQFKFQEYKISRVFNLFRKHNLEPILIKGWAAAQFYPRKEERLFVDIDIAVAPEDYQRAEKILFDFNEEKLTVDLHKGLRRLDNLEWTNLFENSRLVNIGETPIRILRAEDHLRVLCVHWLGDGAEVQSRLWDIYYAVENRPPDFDWDRLLNSVGEKRKTWILCALGLAQIYFGLNLENTPAATASEQIPKWVIDTVEKEWKEQIRLKRLQDVINDRRELFQQLKKRFPPNPIQATIEVRGNLKSKAIFVYQIGDIIIRTVPSLQRFAEKFRNENF